jgi:hypothetical protein
MSRNVSKHLACEQAFNLYKHLEQTTNYIEEKHLEQATNPTQGHQIIKLSNRKITAILSSGLMLSRITMIPGPQEML